MASNADYAHHVEEGGKIAAARDLIFYEEQITVRDLHTGKPIEKIRLEETNIKVCTFFASMQQAINVLAVREPKYRPFVKRTKHIDKVMSARALKVREPGKDRYLVIGSATRYFLCTPASRLIADYLGTFPELHMGLKSFGQAFRVREAMANGELAKEIYDSRGFKRTSSLFCSSDWSNATDELPKAFGMALIERLLTKVGMPEFYKTLILDLSSLDEVVEVKDEVIMNRDSFNMGNVLTKSMLTLAHMALIERAQNVAGKFYDKISPEWRDLKIPEYRNLSRGFVNKPTYEFRGHANWEQRVIP
jgi:hypothetical protein